MLHTTIQHPVSCISVALYIYYHLSEFQILKSLSSLSGMAWDAALKLTGVKLDLFDNEEMYTFTERSIRGGISQISKRFAKANNAGCKDYDPLKPITYLIYLDANNLYGWAMSQFLPTGSFRWLTSEEIERLVIEQLDENSEYGYIFEVSSTFIFIIYFTTCSCFLNPFPIFFSSKLSPYLSF